MNIDPKLLSDCHVIGTLDRATVLLNRNACVGWMILVPDTAAVDWHELGDAEHERVCAQLRALAGFVARWFEADKLNVATLGNEVSQMHLHVIARHHDDACWPKPVWGHLEMERRYPNSALTALRTALEKAMGLRPAAQA